MLTSLHQHIVNLRVYGASIRDDELKVILNNVYEDFHQINMTDTIENDTGFKGIQNFCKHMMDNEIYRKSMHPPILEHKLFTLMSRTLLTILEKDNHNEREWNAFHAIATLFDSVISSSTAVIQSKYDKEIFSNDTVIDAIKLTMNRVSMSDDYQSEQYTYCILNYMLKHPYSSNKIKSNNAVCTVLLDPIAKCITSKFYIEIYFFDGEPEDFHITTANFLQLHCPHFLLTNSGDRQQEISNILCQPLLNHSAQILSHRDRIKYPLNLSRGLEKYKPNQKLLYYLQMLNFCAMVESTRDIFAQHIYIVENLFKTIPSYLDFESSKEIKIITEGELLLTTLTLMFNLTCNPIILDAIRNNYSFKILLQLCVVHKKVPLEKKNDVAYANFLKNIQFAAQAIVALTLENIDLLNKPEEITSSYITYLAKTVKDPLQMHKGVHLSSLVTNVNAIAQNKQVKVQLVEQKGLPLLTRCACDNKFDESSIKEPALNAIWTVSFNQKARDLWKNDHKLIDHLKLLLKSDNTEQQQAANGILWRLINEAKFKAEHTSVERILHLSDGAIEDTIVEEEDGSWVRVKRNGLEYMKVRGNLTDEEQRSLNEELARQSKPQKKDDVPYVYDLMISYCHENDALCHIVHDCLAKIGKYKIWIDKNKMYGSLMERMAEAIEESHIILVCMSKDYKLSQACQAEAEYAFSRKRQLIFLKVEPNYKPNGWLGLLLGSKYYTDFTKPDFESKFKDLFEQINHQRKDTCDYTLIDPIVTPKILESVKIALIPKRKPVPASTATKSSTETNNHTANPPVSMIRILSGNQQSTSLASRRKLSAPTNKKAATSLVQPQGLTQTITTLTTIKPTAKFQHGTSTTLLSLNLSNSPTPRSSSSSTPLPPITPKTTDSTPLVSTREEKQETPMNPMEINGESYNPEELNYNELYPSDFDYSSSEEEEDNGFNSFVNGVRENIRTPLSSISSISDDEIEDLTMVPAVLNVKPSKTETVPALSTFKQNDSTAVSTSKQNSSTAVSTVWYEKKPIDKWTQQDVLKFLTEKNLNNILQIFGDDEINGRHLQELYYITKPTTVASYEALKRKLSTLEQVSIPRTEYERFLTEVEKLITPRPNSETLICNIM